MERCPLPWLERTWILLSRCEPRLQIGRISESKNTRLKSSWLLGCNGVNDTSFYFLRKQLKINIGLRFNIFLPLSIFLNYKITIWKTGNSGWQIKRSRILIKSWSKVYKPYTHYTRKTLPGVIAPNSDRPKLSLWRVMRPLNSKWSFKSKHTVIYNIYYILYIIYYILYII